MAEGDEVWGLFGGLDACDACGGEDVAFGDLLGLDEGKGVWVEVDFCGGFGLAEGVWFGGDVDHVDFAFWGDVGELWLGHGDDLKGF